MLYSIGYGNRSILYFEELLRNYSISCLVDVRSWPDSSFNKQFCKSFLSKRLRSIGVDYIYMGEILGGDEALKAVNGGYSLFSNYYLAGRDLRIVRALRKIVSLSLDRNVVIMCSEKDPLKCHRFCFVSYLVYELFSGKEILHILDMTEVYKTSELLSSIVRHEKFIGRNFMRKLVFQRLRLLYSVESHNAGRDGKEVIHNRFL